MVSVNEGMRTIFQGAYTEKLNVSEFIDSIDPRDIPFLAMLGWGTEAGSVSAGVDTLAFPCTRPQHTWQNDTLIPQQGTVGSAYTSGGGILTLAAEEEHYIRVGDQLLVNDVHYIVTGLNGDDTIDVTVLSGSSDANHASGDRWYNLGSLRLDGETFPTDYLSTDITSDTNFTQIFTNAISVSGTSEATEKYGIADEFDREFAKKFSEMILELEYAAMYGLRSSTFPTANSTRSAVRRMGGLYNFVRANSDANRTNAASATLTEKMLVDLLQSIWEDGGKPDTIMVNATQKRVLDSFIVPFVRTDISNERAGVILGQYVSDFGTLDVVLSRRVRPSDLIVFQKEFIGIGPLKGNGNDRSFFMTPVPVKGDSREAVITGEYTMEVRNADAAHGWIYNLGTTLA